MSPARARPVAPTVLAIGALAAGLAASAAGATPLLGQEGGLLVSADWLAANLDDPTLVVLHVGPEDEFATEHIAGAVYMARDDFSHPGSHSPESLILELPEPDAFQGALRRAGIREDSRIVVYWGGEWVTPGARVVFTLDWAGLGGRTSLLDGGLTAWKAAGHPVTAETSVPEPGDVTIAPRDLVVGADWVRANAGAAGVQVVDARAAAFFDGVREDRGVAGHIPGAGNLPWTELVDEESLLLHPRERLRELFDAAGVSDGDTVVGYCHIGQYATLMLFSARLLGHDVVLYDGAFQDWAAREMPVESGR